jgi:hypothetical protein
MSSQHHAFFFLLADCRLFAFNLKPIPGHTDTEILEQVGSAIDTSTSAILQPTFSTDGLMGIKA